VFVATRDDGAGDDGRRTFVWALTRWYERVTGTSGAVDFAPIAEDDEGLRDLLREQGMEMDEVDGEFAETVREEFINQTPLYVEGPNDAAERGEDNTSDDIE
jgi:hypothetical protein